jgi:cytochrome P450
MVHAQQPSNIEQEKQSGGCPIDHSAFSRQKTAPVVEPVALPVELDETGTWHIRGFDEARSILRNANTRQAGFGAEQIGNEQMIQNKPILYQEGKVHLHQRKQTARFFTPKTVSSSYRQFIDTLADQLVGQLQRHKQADLSKLSLALAVPVAARVVGLTNSILPGMALRLEAFFQQAATKKSRFSLPAWLQIPIIRNLLDRRQMLAFYFLDVRPAIQARKRQPQEDVISHLISLNYSDPEILTECVTYAAAGMATTREFISTAAWHLLEQPELKARYLAAPEEERFEMLHEALRLEPVIANLYRYATSDIKLSSQGTEYVIPEGARMNIHIYATNADELIVGEESLAYRPGRAISSERIPTMLMGFGDGAHRCPGSFLAIQETDIFLHRLLALESLHIKQLPKITWNEITAGYEVRKFQVAL